MEFEQEDQPVSVFLGRRYVYTGEVPQYKGAEIEITSAEPHRFLVMEKALDSDKTNLVERSGVMLRFRNMSWAEWNFRQEIMDGKWTEIVD